MSLATLEARTGTRTVSARGLAYHSPVTRSSCAGSEGEWIAQVADGDADAFARLYDAWSSRLFALILQIVVDRAQSEEVLQEVFLEVWRTAGSYSPARGSVRAWLVTMARRRAIDRVRSSQSSRERESRWRDYMPDVDQTVQQVEDRLVGEQVHRALEAVGEPYRSTIELAYFTGLTHREIARRTNTPLGTVKTRIRDGMARLRRELGVQS